MSEDMWKWNFRKSHKNHLIKSLDKLSELEQYRELGDIKKVYEFELNKNHYYLKIFSILNLIMVTIIGLFIIFVPPKGFPIKESSFIIDDSLRAIIIFMMFSFFLLFATKFIDLNSQLRWRENAIEQKENELFGGIPLMLNIPYKNNRQLICEFFYSLDQDKRELVTDLLDSEILKYGTDWDTLLADEIEKFESHHKSIMYKEWMVFIKNRGNANKNGDKEDLYQLAEMFGGLTEEILKDNESIILHHLKGNKDIVRFVLESPYCYPLKLILKAIGLSWGELKRKHNKKKNALSQEQYLIDLENEIKNKGVVLKKSLACLNESENNILAEILAHWRENPDRIPDNEQLSEFYIKCRAGEIQQVSVQYLSNMEKWQ